MSARARRRRALRRLRMWLALRLQKRRRSHGGRLLDGLSAYWKLEEEGGMPRLDSHGGFDLADVNGVAQAPGKMGYGAEFTYESGDRWLEVADDEKLRLDGDFTFACWAYRIETVWGGEMIFCKGSAMEFWLQEQGAYAMRVDLYGEGVDGDTGERVLTLVANTTVPQFEWTHVAVRKAGNGVQLFLNGALDGAGEASEPVAVGGATTLGGALFGYPFSGYLDEAAFWKRALSAEEISLLYGGGAGLAYEDF